jgi:hypothetical protein
MLSRLFPKQLDNRHQGYTAAIWLLVVIIALKLVMAGAALFDTSDMIKRADSIPLESFGPAAAAAVLATTKLLGLDHALLNLVGLIALIRWRAMTPFVYLLLLIEQVGRKAVVLTSPIARTGIAYLPVDPNLVLAAALLIGLALSLATPRTVERKSAT